MSKIDEMLKQMCPDGVEYRSLGEIFHRERGRGKDNPQISQVFSISSQNGFVYAEEYRDKTVFSDDTSNYTVVKQGMFAYNPSRLNIGSIAINDKGDGLVSPMYVVFSIDDHIDKQYMMYLLKSRHVMLRISALKESGARFRFDFSRWRKIYVPIPPIEIQQEIVKTLDSFVKYDIELQAELQARIKQYEYYRDKLLSFDEIGQRGGVTYKPLGEIFNIKNGYTPSKSNRAYWDNGNIPWFRMEDIRENGRILDDSIQHVTPEAVKGSLCAAGSIIMSTSATIGEYALIERDFVANQRFTILSVKDEYRKRLDKKFVFHYCHKLSNFCKENLNQGNFASVDMNKVLKFPFAIPPLHVQSRIVSVLDNFDKICSDLKIGLPAEIEKRQKQYEYYRDKLLTFEPKS